MIGLTGPTGAGKSEAARVFARQGCVIIDADMLSRRVVEKGSPCLRALTEHFSDAILYPDGSLNRKALAAVAFSSPEQTEVLNRLVHPAIIRMIEEKLMLAQSQGEWAAVIDAPLLFQAGLNRLCDVTLAVSAPPELRLQRICLRDDLTEEQALTRMSAQPDDVYFTQRATHTIDNSGAGEAFHQRVEALLSHWKEECGGRQM